MQVGLGGDAGHGTESFQWPSLTKVSKVTGGYRIDLPVAAASLLNKLISSSSSKIPTLVIYQQKKAPVAGSIWKCVAAASSSELCTSICVVYGKTG
jgi:hypothetical protein